MQFLIWAHPVKINLLIDSDRIIIEHLVEFAKLEEYELIKIVLLQPPVLNHATGHLFPCLRWHMHRSRVIFRMVRPSHSGIFDYSGFSPVRFALLDHLRRPVVIRPSRWVESGGLSLSLHPIFVDLFVFPGIVLFDLFGCEFLAMLDGLLSHGGVDLGVG